MEKRISREYVTVIRKRGCSYRPETINTDLVLQGSDITPAENRRGVIDRLREDPSVILILDGKKGECRQVVTLRGGTEVSVIIIDGDHGSSTIRVHQDGKADYEQTWSVSDGRFQDEDAYEEFVLRQLCNVISIIQDSRLSYAPEDLGFLDHFNHQIGDLEDAGVPIELWDAWTALKAKGYQTETICRIGLGINAVPFLFVYENEVMMLGTRHFDRTAFFVERKLLYACDGEQGSMLKEFLGKKQSDIEWIEYADGSRGLRLFLGDCCSEEEFMLLFNTAVKELMAITEAANAEIPSLDMNGQRQMFLYEVIDAQVKYFHLPV